MFSEEVLNKIYEELAEQHIPLIYESTIIRTVEKVIYNNTEVMKEIMIADDLLRMEGGKDEF